MNIGIVTPFYPDAKTIDSGLANHFHTLANGLVAAGHQVVVVHLRPAYADEEDSRTTQQLHNLIVVTYSVKPLKRARNWAVADFSVKLRCMLKLFNELNNIIQQYQLQVIETTSYYALCWLYLFKKQLIPVVIRVSTTYLQILDKHYPFRSRLLRTIGQLEIRMMRSALSLVTHAHGHAAEMQALYGISQKRFTIIPHGTILPQLTPSGVNAGTKTRILFVGRFEHRKGIDVLLAAIPLVIRTCPDARFELVGADTDNAWQKMFEQEHKHAFDGLVAFAGNLDQAATEAAFAGCDIFVAPSRYESFGLIFIEAMSYGKPVIGCHVGGVTGIIENEYNGLYAAVDNAADLSEKLIRLIGDHGLRRCMGENARKTVEDKFSSYRLAESSVAYYRQRILEFTGA